MHVLDENPNETYENTIVLENIFTKPQGIQTSNQNHQKSKNQVDESKNPKIFAVFGAEELEGEEEDEDARA